MNRRLAILASVSGTLLIASALEGVSAQEAYPNGPITMVVSWGAGGAADTGARALAEATKRFLGQEILVQNIAGGGGALGAVSVAKAKPDGYTIMFTTTSLVTQPHFSDVPYKTLEDLSPVIQVGGYPTMFVVKKGSRFEDFKAVVEYAKKNPGKLTYSTSGFGSIHHLLAEQLFQSAGIQLTHVPFKDLRRGVIALLGGNVDLAAAIPSDVVSDLEEGRVRALGLFLGERYSELPDIPTWKEQGFDAIGYGWWGVAVPVGTPKPIVEKLESAFRKGMENPPFTTVMNRLKLPIIYLDSEATLMKWKKDYQQFGSIAKGLKR